MLRVFTDDRCLGHRVPPGFPERAVRLKRIVARLEERGVAVERQGDHPETESAVRAVHAGEYVERFRSAVARRDGLLDSADNPLNADTWDAARAAVSTALHAADWTVSSAGTVSFAAVRPPGHHAERDMAMGFCFFNNVAVAASYLKYVLGLQRVAIFDFDVHHGNGTQHIFEEDADFLYASVHQHPFYPGTGLASEIGRGEGRGATLNIPLPAGSGDADYQEVLDRRIVPAIRSFQPDVLLLSSGFDAWQADPLGGMELSVEGYRATSRRLRQMAEETCDGRVLSVLEGGYDFEALPDLVVAHLDGLMAG